MRLRISAIITAVGLLAGQAWGASMQVTERFNLSDFALGSPTASCVTAGTETGCSNSSPYHNTFLTPTFDSTLGTLTGVTVRLNVQSQGIFILRGDDVAAPTGFFNSTLGLWRAAVSQIDASNLIGSRTVRAELSNGIFTDSTRERFSLTFSTGDTLNPFTYFPRTYTLRTNQFARVNQSGIACWNAACGATSRVEAITGTFTTEFTFTPPPPPPTPVVPLPAAGWMLLTALTGLALRRRGSRKEVVGEL